MFIYLVSVELGIVQDDVQCFTLDHLPWYDSDKMDYIYSDQSITKHLPRMKRIKINKQID